MNLKADCGAKGDGKTNDTAAFQKAAKLIQAKGGGVLIVARGTYIVGEQKHEAGKYPYYQVQPIFQVKDLNGLLIEGNGATLRLAPGLRFGSFDKETGAVHNPAMPFYDADYAAHAGTIVQVSNSQNVIVRNLELDGNLSELKLGGFWGDVGRQLWAYGLHFYNNSNVHIDRVKSHHHATDGMAIGWASLKESDPATPHTLTDCSFENNGRQGLSWVGGRGITALRCKFNHTGRALNNGQPLSSPPGAGLDIEAEDSVARDGYFEDCEFINNGGSGIVADSGDGGYSRFKNCTFWGTTSWSAWSNKPGLRYEDSKFYGSVVHAVGSPNPALATTWTRCHFEDKPWANGNVYRQNSSAYLVELNGKLENVKFDHCTFVANTSKSIWIDANETARPTLLGCTIIHKKADLPTRDFVALFRHVVMKDTVFKENYPDDAKQEWYFEIQNTTVEGGVKVEGPRVKWQNWSWGLTGDIPAKTY